MEESTSKINALREDINKLDDEIIKLLDKRNQKALEIGEIKKKNSKEIFSSSREKFILEKIKNSGKFNKNITKVYEQILIESKKIQK